MEDRRNSRLAGDGREAGARIGRSHAASAPQGHDHRGQDIRGLKGTALCFATATRGCDHLRAAICWKFHQGKNLITRKKR